MRILATLMLLALSPALFGAATVDGVRLWHAPESSRLVLDISDKVSYKSFLLDNPSRLVVDLQNTRLKAKLPSVNQDDALFRRLRAGIRAGKDLRLVLDLSQGVFYKSYMLEPNREYGRRLVIDAEPKAPKQARKARAAVSSDVSEKESSVAITEKNGDRDIVIMIDPGHGGEDVGATGPRGVHEKDVVLQISKRLANELNKKPGLRAELTRKGDYFLGLRKRNQLAREARADLFVSIHADAFRDHRVRGSSVYTLSNRGASSEAARWLAERENSSDLVGGVSLDDKDDLLASVLLDLSQNATLEASMDVAADVLHELKSLGKTHKKTVQQAGFVVLKSPDIPSILVETAFITNPQEERNLADQGFQNKLAHNLALGISRYFTDQPPTGTLWAKNVARRHVIARGETLSEIANAYAVDLNALKRHNRLAGDNIRIGQVIHIPKG